MARDMMRSRIENAETLFMISHAIPELPLTDLQSFARAIQNRSWWKKNVASSRFGPIEVEWSPSSRNCVHRRSQHPTVCVAQNGATKLHVLHSMAHLLLDDGVRSPTHDVEFIKTYLELVRRYLNGTIDENAKRSFKKYLVQSRVKTKTVSEETRAKQQAAAVIRRMPSKDQLINTLRKIEDA